MIHDLIRYARDVRNARPRIHGNGFLQLDLTDTVRLHVWGHPEIPRQRVETPIHDHTFTFSSIVLRGVLLNRRYDALPSQDYSEVNHRHWWPYIAQVRQGEDTILVPANVTSPLYMHLAGEDIIKAGDGYFMSAGAIHESVPQCLTVSIINKHGKTLAQGGPSPRVYVPHGVKPDNDFNRYALPADICWRIIEDAVAPCLPF